MSRPNNFQSRSAAKPTLTAKQALLPLPRPKVVETLLAAYLSLVACRNGQGHKHQLFELVHATYLSYVLWRQGYGTAGKEIFSAAEKELDAAAQKGYLSDIWHISLEAEMALRPVLQVYDQQIATVPVRVLIEARKRLRQLFVDRRGQYLEQRDH